MFRYDKSKTFHKLFLKTFKFKLCNVNIKTCYYLQSSGGAAVVVGTISGVVVSP